jgi:hypothetical protein
LKFTFSNKYPIGKSQFLSRQPLSLSSLSVLSYYPSYLCPISLSDHYGF